MCEVSVSGPMLLKRLTYFERYLIVSQPQCIHV